MQDTARQMLGLLKRHPAGFVGAGKALAERAMGGAAPLGPPRPPISALSDAAGARAAGGRDGAAD